jgi:glycosyltransferase involved in cell wall biosynthesis
MERTDGMILIPAYREESRIGAVVREARRYVPWVVVVDDGSPDETASVAREAGAVVLVHAANRGKGGALRTGFQYAREQGAAFVLTMDGDGQHAPEDIPAFLEAFAKGFFPVIVGNRMDVPHGMPLVRRLTNRFMSALLSRKMGQRVPDTQNGFRLYRTDVIPPMPESESGFAAESEILMELARLGVTLGSVPVRIIYAGEQSKIRPLRDTLRFFRMLKAFDRQHGGR